MSTLFQPTIRFSRMNLIYFVWGMMAWMVVPLHTPTLAGLPNEVVITDALRGQSLETGVYVVPQSHNQDD